MKISKIFCELCLSKTDENYFTATFKIIKKKMTQFIENSFEKEIFKKTMILFSKIKDFANSKKSNQWALRRPNKNELRLHFGNFIVANVGNGQLWMSLDNKLKEEEFRLLENNKNMWRWSSDRKPDIARYKRIPSLNGYLNTANSNTEIEEIVLKANFIFIENVSDSIDKNKNKIKEETINKHEPEMEIFVNKYSKITI